ncbi:MAG: flavin reductase family protein [Aestuariibacter sp.]
MMTIYSRRDIDLMPSRYRANFVNCLSGFKSANLIGTQSKANGANLAVFNSVFHVGANPPLLGMVVRPHTVRRDTLENILETGEFTINHISAEMVSAAHQTSAKYPQNISEFDAVGLTPEYRKHLSVPYVGESRIKIGLSCQEVIPIKANNTHIVIGEIQEVVAPEEALHEDGQIRLESLNGITINGLDSYYRAQFLARFDYATPE